MMRYRLACALRMFATMLQVAQEEAQKQVADSEQRLAKLQQEISRLQVLVLNYFLAATAVGIHTRTKMLPLTFFGCHKQSQNSV